jgi:hypothetical protein
METNGVPRKAISRAFFSAPVGRLERRDGTINSHHHQNPKTLIETSLESNEKNSLDKGYANQF